MANKKISELEELITIANDDYLVILDSSEGQTKKVKREKIILNEYSTNEIVVGTWIDNRPIYRKVVTANNILLENNVTINHNIQNIDMVLPTSFVALYDTNGNITATFPTIGRGSNDGLSARINRTYIEFDGNLSWSAYTNRTLYAIIEYIKTTD